MPTDDRPCVAVIGRLRGSKKAAFLHRQAIDKQLELIRKALDSQSGDGQLQFPFVIIRAQDFLTARGLLSHEELRREGRLVVIDTLTQLKHFERKQRIIFFSHRAWRFSPPLPAQPPARPSRGCSARTDGSARLTRSDRVDRIP